MPLCEERASVTADCHKHATWAMGHTEQPVSCTTQRVKYEFQNKKTESKRIHSYTYQEPGGRTC